MEGRLHRCPRLVQPHLHNFECVPLVVLGVEQLQRQHPPVADVPQRPEHLGQWGYTMMVDDYRASQLGVGAGLRLDRYWPGWVGVAGFGAFGKISKNTFEIDFSGGGLRLDGGYKLSELWAVRAEFDTLFLNKGLGHFQFVVGVRFGN